MADNERMAVKGLLSVLRGAVDRHVKQRPRDTILRNAMDDPAEPLAQRVTENDACDFCNRFANDGPVNPRSVSEKFHQFCKCHFMLFFQETKHRDRFVDDRELEKVGIDIEQGAYPDDWEKRDALVLAALGKKVRFLKRHPHGARMADVLVDGVRVEFKNPKSGGKWTVQYQIQSNLYGRNKSVFKPQSDTLLISNVRNSMTMTEMEESLAAAFGPDSLLSASDKAYMRKIILLDERTRRVRVYELKKPALHGSEGHGHRQRNISTNATSKQTVGEYSASVIQEQMAIKQDFPAAYEDWQTAVGSVGTRRTSQSIRKHIPGTKEFLDAESPSYFYVDEGLPVSARIESVKAMIDDYAGKGVPVIDQNGDWARKERVNCGKIIGVDGWSRTETSGMNIYYGDGKVHASPRYDGSGQSFD